MKITKDVILVKSNISVWLSTIHLLSKWRSILLSRWFVESQTEILLLTNFTSLVFFNYLPPCLSFWLSFLLLKIGIYSKHSPYKRHSWHKTDLHIGYKRIKCQCSPHIVTSQLICCVNQLIGFYIRATLTFNGLSSTRIAKQDIYIK